LRTPYRGYFTPRGVTPSDFSLAPSPNMAICMLRFPLAMGGPGIRNAGVVNYGILSNESLKHMPEHAFLRLQQSWNRWSLVVTAGLVLSHGTTFRTVSTVFRIFQPAP